MASPAAIKHFKAEPEIIAETSGACDGPSASLAICDRGSDACIGSCGAIERGDGIEIFCLVFPEARRRGAAHEAARLLSGELHRQHFTATLIAFIDPANTASVAILERVGLQDAGPMAVSGKSGRRYILAPVDRTSSHTYGAIGRSGFGGSRMRAVVFAVGGLEYHSAPAET